MRSSSETITVRPAGRADEPFLREMLYHAIYVPPGQPPLPREVVGFPEISRYVDGWGRPGDAGEIATERDTPIGAAWLRLWTKDDPGYGFVDETTPELSIAVLPGYRGRGIGSSLLRSLLEAARVSWRQVSLSVDPDNPARRLYERFRFQVVGSNGSSLIMLKQLVPRGRNEPSVLSAGVEASAGS